MLKPFEQVKSLKKEIQKKVRNREKKAEALGWWHISLSSEQQEQEEELEKNSKRLDENQSWGNQTATAKREFQNADIG